MEQKGGSYKFKYRTCKESDFTDLGVNMTKHDLKNVGLSLCPDMSFKDKQFILSAVDGQNSFLRMSIAQCNRRLNNNCRPDWSVWDLVSKMYLS